jgi:diguanylate cyclase (GGDEF)-like protein
MDLTRTERRRGWPRTRPEASPAPAPTPGTAPPFAEGVRGLLLGAAGLAAVAVIALFDYWTGPDLSFAVFYFLPVAAAAWWGSQPHGLLLSLAAAAAWHTVDSLEGPEVSAVARTWNDVVRFGVFVISSSLLGRLRNAIVRERLLARTDPLTGAANARTFYEALGAEARWSREVGRPLTLAYLDLDNFKQLNDRLGHAAGDTALRHFAQTVRGNIRAEDLLARLGGDEFALLLPETDSAAARDVLRRLHDLIGREMAAQGWGVTASVGVATFLRPPVDVDVMLHRTDALMYVVKRRGKNRFEHEEVAAERGADGGLGAHRRAEPRLPCGRPARVWSEELSNCGEEPATVRDISTGGVGLHSRSRFPPPALVMVEPPPGCAGKALLARVVRCVPEDGGWFHGCVLYTRLKEEELREWRAGAPAAEDDQAGAHAVETA